MKSIKIKPIKSIALLVSILTLGFTSLTQGQVAKDSKLFKTLKANDSLLFNIGFNTCDMSKFENLIADDFEFYHDNSGINNSKEEFLISIKKEICLSNNNVTINRTLVTGSLTVFPLYDNGTLYGAIQKGEHIFNEHFKDGNSSQGSIAKFTHLWIKKEGFWKIKRVLSYDHKAQVKTSNTTYIIKDLNRYTGIYNSNKKQNVIISIVDNNLQIDIRKKQAILYAISETDFFIKEAPVTFEFVSNTEGVIEKFLVKENGKVVDHAIKTIN